TREALRARGATLFAANECGNCHVAGLAAPGVAVKKLEDLTDRYTLENLENYFLAPQPPMPTFELTELDRRALAVYLLAERGRE
ncbi:MAG TPA: cytochrome c, partial [Myxococcales bacterium]|nr:cytochrome c [Myxococcales bacterium]